MTELNRNELTFIARDLRSRNTDVRALYLTCGDNEGAAEQAIEEAARLIDKAARRLETAAHAKDGPNLKNLLRLSIQNVRAKRQCAEVGSIPTNEKARGANASPFLNSETVSNPEINTK